MADNILKSHGETPVREYWLNADFDSSLAGRPPLLETTDQTYVHEMAWHFLFAGSARDSVLVHRPLPAGFLAYVKSKGLALPRIVLHPEFTREAEFHPFGWNAQARAMAARYAGTATPPSLEAIRKANSRAFCLTLEKSGDADCKGSLFTSMGQLEAWLVDRSPGEEWLLKGEHGYAGTANVRIRGGSLAGDMRLRVESLFADHGRAVLEPWHTRLLDMAALFRVSPHGTVEEFRGHVLLNSRDGAFLGVQIAADCAPPAAWCDALRLQAEKLALALVAIGYHGPVGLDAYVREAPEGPRLRPLVDVNARLSMALPAHGLARRLPDRHILWTWMKPRKLKLPEDYTALDAILGPDAFSADTRRGILAVSPLRLEDVPRRGPEDSLRPRRVGFALIAADENDLGRLRETFARALGRS